MTELDVMNAKFCEIHIENVHLAKTVQNLEQELRIQKYELKTLMLNSQVKMGNVIDKRPIVVKDEEGVKLAKKVEELQKLIENYKFKLIQKEKEMIFLFKQHFP